MNVGRRLEWLTWRRFLAVAGVAVALRALVPSARVGQALSVLISGVCVACVWVGVSRVRSPNRRPALWFAVALSLYFAGDLFFYYYLLLRQSARPFPSVADALYLTDLPIFIGAILLFIRAQNPGRDIASLLDGAIVATVCGLLSWLYVIQPTVAVTETPVLDRVIGMAYPLLDVLMLTMAVRLLLIRGPRPRAHVLLAAGVLCLTAADTLYNFLNVLPGLPLVVEPYYLLWVVWYVLAASAFLHPSMAAGATVGDPLITDRDRARIVLLAAVVLVAPALVIVEGARDEDWHLPVIGAASMVLFGLVMARMSMLMRSLGQARADAEAANAAKSLFLATVSHEIRTPLHAVIGLSSVLMQSDLDHEQRAWAETVVSSGQSLLSLINDILDFSKIESGAMPMADEPFDLAECVEAALGVVAPEAAACGLRLDHRIDPDLPAVVRGDAIRLRQVLVNLLSNAVKFTDEGEVSLTVQPLPAPAAAVGDPAGRVDAAIHLYVAVRDSGIGIPAEAQAEVFRAFFQVEGSAARRHGGSGLGLAISRRLCELMGGTVWLDSEPGVGSTFHFTVAVRPAPDAARPEVADSLLAGKRLLILDADASSRDTLTEQARRLGMQPTAAARADEARSWLARGDRFDVAVVDLVAAGGDGAALAGELAGHHIPIVALASIGQRSPVGAGGLAGWLTRPVRRAPLVDALRRALDLTTAPGGSEAGGATGGLHVLVAEDNPVNQRVIGLFLERLGHHAVIVADGRAALRAVEERAYDVILMDMQMPEMDGLEASRLLRQRHPGSQARIIGVTANAIAGDRELCIAAGMDDYLSKPFSMDELAHVLASHPHVVGAPR